MLSACGRADNYITPPDTGGPTTQAANAQLYCANFPVYMGVDTCLVYYDALNYLADLGGACSDAGQVAWDALVLDQVVDWGDEAWDPVYNPEGPFGNGGDDGISITPKMFYYLNGAPWEVLVQAMAQTIAHEVGHYSWGYDDSPESPVHQLQAQCGGNPVV